MATPHSYLHQPFSPTSTGPRFFHVTSQASAAIAKTTFVLQRRQGLTLIIGKVGFGKTSLLRYIEDALREDDEYFVARLAAARTKDRSFSRRRHGVTPV